MALMVECIGLSRSTALPSKFPSIWEGNYGMTAGKDVSTLIPPNLAVRLDILTLMVEEIGLTASTVKAVGATTKRQMTQ